jgi:hypothetical protein
VNNALLTLDPPELPGERCVRKYEVTPMVYDPLAVTAGADEDPDPDSGAVDPEPCEPEP